MLIQVLKVKKKDLLKKHKTENFIAPKNSNESYEDFINRQKEVNWG